MDEHRHKILVTLVFFMVILKKNLNRNPFIAHEQAQNLNKKRGKWREMKQKKIHIGFGLRFTLILQCGLHQNNNIFLLQH